MTNHKQAICRFRILLFWLVLTFSANALGQLTKNNDAVVEQAWMSDPQDVLSPQQAIQGHWTPFKGTLVQGFVKGATWLRIKLDPSVVEPRSLPQDHRLVLQIIPGHLDEVFVFRVDRLMAAPWVVGDKVAPPKNGDQFISHTVIIPDVTAPIELLLRLRTRSSHVIRVYARSWDAAHIQNTWQVSTLIAFLVFTLTGVFWAFVVWIDQHSRVMALFIGSQIVVAILGFSLIGGMRYFFSDIFSVDTINGLTSFCIPFFMFILISFNIELLIDLGAQRQHYRFMRALLVIPVIALLLFMSGYVEFSLMFTHLTVPFTQLCLVVMAWQIKPIFKAKSKLGQIWQRFNLVAVYLVMTLISIPQSLRLLGISMQSPLGFGQFMIFSIVSTLLLAIQLRYLEWHKRQETKTVAIALSKKTFQAEMQKERIKEQSELVAMLAHELKTPMSVFSLALSSSNQDRRTMRAINSMKSVIERCEQMARLDEELERPIDDAASHPIFLTVLLSEALSVTEQSDRIECRIANDLPMCWTDHQLLSVIVGNLLDNALKYSPPGSRVTISVEAIDREGQSGFSLCITNSVGRAGRPDPGNLFKKFYRNPHARYLSGSGLGLYLAYQFATRLGGSLSMHGDEQVTFTLWLPFNIRAKQNVGFSVSETDLD